MASSKVFEQSSPIESESRRATLPALRADITAGTDAWQLIPTRAIFSAPPSTASAVGQGVGRVGVAGTGRGQDLVAGAGHGRHGLPGGPVALRGRTRGRRR